MTIDAMGNTFAVRPGKNKTMDAPPTCAGSHLDTQPSGGRYVSRTLTDSVSFADYFEQAGVVRHEVLIGLFRMVYLAFVLA